MNQYQVFCSHHICEDSYEAGEMGTYNSYDDHGIYKAESPMDAVKAYYEKALGWEFHEEYIEFDDGALHDSRLVDENSCIASEWQIEEWKADKLRLWCDDIRITVKQLIAIDLE